MFSSLATQGVYSQSRKGKNRIISTGERKTPSLRYCTKQKPLTKKREVFRVFPRKKTSICLTKFRFTCQHNLQEREETLYPLLVIKIHSGTTFASVSFVFPPADVPVGSFWTPCDRINGKRCILCPGDSQ